MPTILREDGFRILILLPPREHPPAHVHVVKHDGLVVIRLAIGDLPQATIRVAGEMKAPDLRRAERIVAENTPALLARWRQIHA
jgi:hypothetical protein